MQPFCKISIIFLCMLLILFTLTACNNDEYVDYSEYHDTPIPQKELDILINMTFQDVSQFVTTRVNKTTQNFSHAKIINLDIFEDNLLLKRDDYKKAFNNIFIKISVNLVDVPESEIESVVSEYNDAIYEAFAGEELEIIKIRSIFIDYTLGNRKMEGYSHEITFTNLHKTIRDLTYSQDENLEIIDKVFYEILSTNVKETLSREHEEYEITHLGIKDNKYLSNIVIYVYLGENFEEELESMNGRIYEEIKENNTLTNYFIDNGISIIEFNYNAIWYSDDTLVYTFKVN